MGLFELDKVLDLGLAHSSSRFRRYLSQGASDSEPHVLDSDAGKHASEPRLNFDGSVLVNSDLLLLSQSELQLDLLTDVLHGL